MIVSFQPIGIKQEADIGDNLLHTAEKAAVLIDGTCAGQGTCGKCKVRIIAGEAGCPDNTEKKHLSENEIGKGWRLACRVQITDDLTVYIPGIHGSTARKKDLIFLPEGFSADKRIFSDRDENGHYGIAFDIGTTTVVGLLWDLENSRLINAAARTNPQSAYGADVISRILFCSQKESNLEFMQAKILECFHDILKVFEDKDMIKPSQIREAVAVGNTTMSHLLLKKDPSSLARAPFNPGFYGPVEISAEELGLDINPEATIHVLPNIAGHVGSDIVGVLLASGLKESEGVNLAIDIGTNGEILLSYNGRVLTCSTAAGPAFEGASIFHGMRAASGAIEGVKIQGNNVELSVIDDAEPIGICGSGLIDCISEMLTCGIISKKGRMLDSESAEKTGLPPNLVDRLRFGDNGNEFILHYSGNGENIVINQKDIREVQLAKGAIYAGITILMEQMGIKSEDLRMVLLAGAFGNYIKKESAINIGLLPKVAAEKVISIGNAAGIGACMALLSKSALEYSKLLAEETEHIDLASHPSFQDEYLKAMYF